MKRAGVDVFEEMLRGIPEDQRRIASRMQYEIDRCFYHYGEQFRYPREGVRRRSLRRVVRSLYAMIAASRRRRACGDGLRQILSSAYLEGGGYHLLDDHLRLAGFHAVAPVWEPSWYREIVSVSGLFRVVRKLQHMLERGSAADILSAPTLALAGRLDSLLDDLIREHRLRGLLVASDMPFFERCAIEAFRRAERPTVLFLHGLPGRYALPDDDRTDFLVVWGEKIRDLYISAGFDGSKIRVSGHPMLNHKPPAVHRCSTDDVLVLTKAMSGAQNSDRIRISDRARCVVYLLMVQRALQRCGVRGARLRVHPSENPHWYERTIGTEYYSVDCAPLEVSLQRATLVIGPASTVFLHSLWRGVAYVVFEPAYQGEDFFSMVQPPPFDGSDTRVPVAHTEEELERLLREQPKTDPSILSEYVRIPFDISFMKDIIP